jgi:hypothetical protein
MMGAMELLRLKDVIAEFPHVDDPDVVEKAKSNRALRSALEMTRPENWRGSGLTPEQILPVAIVDGIPVAWVPPADVLKALVGTPSGRRVAELTKHTDEILKDCRTRIGQSNDELAADESTLVRRALDAFEAGYHEAAMALAVAVGESLALWASEPRVHFFDSREEMIAWDELRKKEKYNLAKLELAAVSPAQPTNPHEVLRHALIGPIPRFFTPFWGREGEAMPATTSRHATVHKPTVRHLSTENALLAIMLATSILRESQAWCEEVRIMDVHAEEEED